MKTLLIIGGFLCSIVLGANLAMIVSQASYVDAKEETELTSKLPLRFVNAPETMTVRWVSNRQEVRKVLDEYMEQNPDKPMITGLSMVIGNNCVIYAFKPEYENDRMMQILGHEAAHCYGFRH